MAKRYHQQQRSVAARRINNGGVPNKRLGVRIFQRNVTPRIVAVT